MIVERMLNLTRTLIRIDSVTPGEATLIDFLQRELARYGLHAQRLPVAPGRDNLLARFDAEPARILFNTHVDTVPPQYGPHEDAERIYGRGACDTHGILAAMLEAIDELHNEGLSGIGLLLTVDEEGGEHRGAQTAGRLVPEPDVLIVGEPTRNKLMRFQKGLLKADLRARGREGHSGYPERCDDALARLLDAIQLLRAAPWIGRDSACGNTLNVFFKSAGQAYNKVPEYVHAGLFFRLNEPMNQVKTRVERLLRDNGGLRVELEFLGGNDPIENLAVLPGWETEVAAYNTDIAHFAWRRCRTALFGPGDIAQAHRDLVDGRWEDAEWLSKEEQRRAVPLYVRLVRELLEQAS